MRRRSSSESNSYSEQKEVADDPKDFVGTIKIDNFTYSSWRKKDEILSYSNLFRYSQEKFDI